jgi:hypothetical protein
MCSSRVDFIEEPFILEVQVSVSAWVMFNSKSRQADVYMRNNVDIWLLANRN